MKKLLPVLLFATLFALSGCKDDDDNGSGEVNKPATAVDSGVNLNNGKRIFVRDRNYGASAVGRNGTFMQYAQAVNACPSGYHLMTVEEAVMLCYVYNTPEKMKNGVLKIPLSGFEGGTDSGLVGYYYLDPDGFEWDEMTTHPYLILLISMNTSEVAIYSIEDGAALQVRCVKNYD